MELHLAMVVVAIAVENAAGERWIRRGRTTKEKQETKKRKKKKKKKKKEEKKKEKTNRWGFEGIPRGERRSIFVGQTAMLRAVLEEEGSTIERSRGERACESV